MQTLMLAVNDRVFCLGGGVWFCLTGTEPEPARVRLRIGGEAQPPLHPYLLTLYGQRWYRQGDWLVLAPGIQVCAAGVRGGQAKFYIISHSALWIERGSFEESAA